jgi:hypothetical protein
MLTLFYFLISKTYPQFKYLIISLNFQEKYHNLTLDNDLVCTFISFGNFHNLGLLHLLNNNIHFQIMKRCHRYRYLNSAFFMFLFFLLFFVKKFFFFIFLIVILFYYVNR